jgi:hypothetical protein
MKPLLVREVRVWLAFDATKVGARRISPAAKKCVFPLVLD